VQATTRVSCLPAALSEPGKPFPSANTILHITTTIPQVYYNLAKRSLY